MIKRPGWIMDRLKNVDNKPQAREQITIISAAPAAMKSGQTNPISMMKPENMEQSRTTGTGPDMIMQPGKVAGDVHEGEMVLSANATQALPEDVRQELVKQAESGTLNVDALREALKLDPKPGFMLGSGGMPVNRGVGGMLVQPKNPPPLDMYKGAASTVNTQTDSITGTMPVRNAPKATAIDFKPIDTTITKDVPARAAPSKNSAVDLGPIALAPTRTAPQGTVMDFGTIDNANTISAPVRTAPKGTVIDFGPINTAKPATPTGNPANPAPGNYDNIINSSLRRTLDTAEGINSVDKKIMDQGLKNYDTRAANELAANEMNLAIRTDLPENLKGSLTAQANSGIRSGRSELIGDMSASSADRAAAANQAAAEMASKERTFKTEESRYKDKADWVAYETAVAAGDFKTAADAYQRVTGNAIDMAQMTRYQDYLNKKQGQDLLSGDINNDAAKFNLNAAQMNQVIAEINNGVPLSAINSKYGITLDQSAYSNIGQRYAIGVLSGNIANDAAKFNLNAAQMNQVVADINNGVPLDDINSKYGTSLDQTAYGSIGQKYALSIDSLKTSLGTQKVTAISDAIGKGMPLAEINSQFPGTNMSLAAYKAMYEATPIAERDFNRKLSYTRTLLDAGGETNINEVATIMNELFPGTKFNTSSLISGDKSKRFSTAMGTFTTLIGTPGMTASGAIASMRASGQYEDLAGAFGSLPPAAWTGDPAKNPIITVKNNGTPDVNGANWLIENGYNVATGEPAPDSGIVSMFNGIKSAANPIDAAWKTYSDSAWFKNLKPEQQTDMKALFDYMQTGEALPYDVVTDKDGNTTVVPRSEEKVAGEFTGDPYSDEGLAALKDSAHPQHKAVLDAMVTKIKTSGDFSKLKTLPEGAGDKVIAALKNDAVVWAGVQNINRKGATTSFAKKPVEGSVINFGTGSYYVSSPVIVTKQGGWNIETFMVTDIATGKTHTITSDPGKGAPEQQIKDPTSAGQVTYGQVTIQEGSSGHRSETKKW